MQKKHQNTSIEKNEIKDSDSDVISTKEKKRFLPYINKKLNQQSSNMLSERPLNHLVLAQQSSSDLVSDFYARRGTDAHMKP